MIPVNDTLPDHEEGEKGKPSIEAFAPEISCSREKEKVLQNKLEKIVVAVVIVKVVVAIYSSRGSTKDLVRCFICRRQSATSEVRTVVAHRRGHRYLPLLIPPALAPP